MTPVTSRSEWILLSTAVARMGELDPVYIKHTGAARNHLDWAIFAGRMSLTGRPFREKDRQPIEGLISSEHRLDLIHDTIRQRGVRPPYEDTILFLEVQIEWRGAAAYLRGQARRSQHDDVSNPYDQIRIGPVTEPKRRGPVPGSLDRYGEADRALFSEIDRMVSEQQKSPTAAALILAEQGLVLGDGNELSKAKRLAKLYLQERRKTR
jgi:hypothetical protein